MTQRDAFWDTVWDLTVQGHDIYIITADMGAPALDKFKKGFPHRFINVGIAEQNMILVACGLALEGKKVYCYAIAPFITYRCYEQIRVNVCGMNLPITLVGVGAGFSYADSGYTHHALEDIYIMQILPHMEVDNISDNVMAKWFARESLKMNHPNYVRLDRDELPQIYKEDEDFSVGVNIIRPHYKYIVATGAMVHEALKKEDIGVVDIYRFPTDEKWSYYERLSEDNIFKPLRFKNGYEYIYGGRENIRKCLGLASSPRN